MSAPSTVDGMRLCFLIPASPTDGFLGQIAMFRRSLDMLGGIYEQARVVAVLGDDEVHQLPERWRSLLPRVVLHHVPADMYRTHGYRAQTWARWGLVPPDCDIAVFADADTLPLRPVDDLLERLVRTPGVAGTIAHYPFPQHPGHDPGSTWRALARELIGRDLDLTYTYALSAPEDPVGRRLCPFYLNFGFVLVSRPLVDRIAATFQALATRLAGLLADPYFAGQVALTLTVHAHHVARHAVGLRYNFPNDRRAEMLHPDELADIRVVHYLRTHRFDRQRIFASQDAFDDFLRLELDGSDRRFQDRVREITAARYPFALGQAG
jgi:hypothetical protein